MSNPLDFIALKHLCKALHKCFKAVKQNLQIKTFVGTSENAVKSQIYIALITYLLLQLIKRTIAKKVYAFSNFVEKIRMYLYFYLTLDYACNQVGEGAKRVRCQTKIDIDVGGDLFSAKLVEYKPVYWRLRRVFPHYEKLSDGSDCIYILRPIKDADTYIFAIDGCLCAYTGITILKQKILQTLQLIFNLLNWLN